MHYNGFCFYFKRLFKFWILLFHITLNERVSPTLSYGPVCPVSVQPGNAFSEGVLGWCFCLWYFPCGSRLCWSTYLSKLNGIVGEAAWVCLGTICGSLYMWLHFRICWVRKGRYRKKCEGGEKALLRARSVWLRGKVVFKVLFGQDLVGAQCWTLRGPPLQNEGSHMHGWEAWPLFPGFVTYSPTS